MYANLSFPACRNHTLFLYQRCSLHNEEGMGRWNAMLSNCGSVARRVGQVVHLSWYRALHIYSMEWIWNECVILSRTDYWNHQTNCEKQKACRIFAKQTSEVENQNRVEQRSFVVSRGRKWVEGVKVTTQGDVGRDACTEGTGGWVKDTNQTRALYMQVNANHSRLVLGLLATTQIGPQRSGLSASDEPLMMH